MKIVNSLQLFVHRCIQLKSMLMLPSTVFTATGTTMLKTSETLANDPSSGVPDVEKIEWPVDLTYPNGVSACSKGGWDV